MGKGTPILLVFFSFLIAMMDLGLPMLRRHHPWAMISTLAGAQSRVEFLPSGERKG